MFGRRRPPADAEPIVESFAAAARPTPALAIYGSRSMPQATAPGPAARSQALQRDAVEIARGRLQLAAALFGVLFCAISLRLAYVSLMREGAEPIVHRAAPGGQLQAERADIVDRNGVVLATSLPVASLFANPRTVMDPDDAARRVAAALPDLKAAEIREKLDSDKSFVWIKRALTPREQQAVLAAGVPGLDFQTEERRIYPQGGIAPHVVGYVGVDNKGLAGIEQQFDQQLRGGERVQLALDLRLQRFVESALAAAMQRFSAIGAVGVVMDVETGEIVSLASLPGYDPNKQKAISPDLLFNRAALGVYEQGSTFKIFNTAMALDSGKVQIGSTFDAINPLKIDRFTINDFHGQHRILTVTEVFKYSSNIASARMAEVVGPEGQRAFFDKLGMLKAAQVELPESAAPLYPRQWRKINMYTISFGHGMSVTPLHMVTSVAPIVNGGILYKPTLLKREGRGDGGVRVVSEKTSKHMRDVMRVVVTEGTGKEAAVPGYDVGGKTGTAEKPGRSGYREKALISSFIGAFPMSNPKFLVLVQLDEPKGIKETGGYATGGWVAAPTVKAIIERIVSLYGIPPTDAQIAASDRRSLAALPTAPPAGAPPQGTSGERTVASR